MSAGIEKAVILAEKFLAGVSGNLAKLVVDVDDPAARVGDADDGVLIEGVFVKIQFVSGAAEGFARRQQAPGLPDQQGLRPRSSSAQRRTRPAPIAAIPVASGRRRRFR
jgi:hypothetical protein